MESIAAALYTAALALVGKVGFDIWRRSRERQSIAAGLAGEITAYLDLLNPQQHGRPPPVFDAVAGKLGQLTPDQAKGVSRIYNVVTGMRLLMTGVSYDVFAALPKISKSLT